MSTSKQFPCCSVFGMVLMGLSLWSGQLGFVTHAEEAGPQQENGGQATSSPTSTPQSGIHVLGATYGANCGAAKDNVSSHLAGACEGHRHCTYIILISRIGDPAIGCAKDYSAEYVCNGSSERKTVSAAAEAGNGTRVVLDCQDANAPSSGGAPVTVYWFCQINSGDLALISHVFAQDFHPHESKPKDEHLFMQWVLDHYHHHGGDYCWQYPTKDVAEAQQKLKLLSPVGEPAAREADWPPQK